LIACHAMQCDARAVLPPVVYRATLPPLRPPLAQPVVALHPPAAAAFGAVGVVALPLRPARRHHRRRSRRTSDPVVQTCTRWRLIQRWRDHPAAPARIVALPPAPSLPAPAAARSPAPTLPSCARPHAAAKFPAAYSHGAPQAPKPAGPLPWPPGPHPR
jgi:hypothetical protein